MAKIILNSFFLLLILIFPASAEFDLKVFKVGNGNLIVVKVPPVGDIKTTEYMVIDCGVGPMGDYNQSWRVNERIDDPSKRGIESTLSSPMGKEEILYYKKSDPKEIMLNNVHKYFDETKNRLVGEGNEEKIVIKTLVITHPDKDHCSWLDYVFPANNQKSPKNFKIENIVLGGRPEKYMSLKMQNYSKTFQEWLTEHKKNKIKGTENTQIYFMALKGFNLDDFIEQAPVIKGKKLKQVFEYLESERYQTMLAPPMFSSPDFSRDDLIGEGDTQLREIDFSRVLNFGSTVKFSFLSINPRHEITLPTQVQDREVLSYRVNKDSNDNTDSLVIKIDNKNKGLQQKGSAIIMGDATVVTTQKIINNYSNARNFLTTDVLVAAHHGADTYGSNNLEWINKTQPEYVFLSSGLLYGHPTKATYNVLRKSPRLKSGVTGHKIIVGFNKSNFSEGQTYKGIFSTLTNGDLEAKFLKNEDQHKNVIYRNIIYCDIFKKGKTKTIEIKENFPEEKNKHEDKLDNIDIKPEEELSQSVLLEKLNNFYTANNNPLNLQLFDIRCDFIIDYIDSFNVNYNDISEIKVNLSPYDKEEFLGKITFNSEFKIPNLFIDFKDPRNYLFIEQVVEQYKQQLDITTSTNISSPMPLTPHHNTLLSPQITPESPTALPKKVETKEKNPEKSKVKSLKKEKVPSDLNFNNRQEAVQFMEYLNTTQTHIAEKLFPKELENTRNSWITKFKKGHIVDNKADNDQRIEEIMDLLKKKFPAKFVEFKNKEH